jgi:hypothetical protein
LTFTECLIIWYDSTILIVPVILRGQNLSGPAFPQQFWGLLPL